MIDIHNLDRSYKTGHTETFVLRRIHLHIAPGEFVTIMGPSGAGKSSLLNILAMLDDQWRGEFVFDGTPIQTLNRKQRAELARQRTGMVFQSYHLIDDLTVAENIDLPLSYKDIPRSDRQALVADTLDRFNIVGKKISTPHSSPAASSNSSALPEPSSIGPPFCLPTSPPATSTPNKPPRSCISFANSTSRAQPSSR